MLRNFLSKPEDFKPWMALVLPLWTLVGFIAAQVLVAAIVQALLYLQVPLGGINETVIQTVGSGVIYLLSIGIVIGLPWWIKKYRTTQKELGIDSYVTWTDIFLAPASFIVYLILSLILTAIASQLPFYNVDQVQDTGFTGLVYGYEYMLAFAALVIIAPIAEEVLFRGYLLGKLRTHLPVWAAILVTSLLFAAVHFQFNVGVDVFALSIVLCLLRIQTGRLWPAILLHMIKNSIAFYFLFINPIL